MPRQALPFITALLILAPRLHAQYKCLGLPEFPSVGTAVTGTVVEDSTGRPLPQVFLLVNSAPHGWTNCDGVFVLSAGRPGDTITTESEYFLPQSTLIPATPGVVPAVTFRLNRRLPKPLPSDSLLGAWLLRLWKPDHRPGPYFTGSLTILPGAWTPLGTIAPALHSANFGALLPGFDHWAPPESLQVIIAADSVTIWLTPDVYDAGYSVHALIEKDSVVGTWCAHTFSHDCVPQGRATLTRQ